MKSYTKHVLVTVMAVVLGAMTVVAAPKKKARTSKSKTEAVATPVQKDSQHTPIVADSISTYLGQYYGAEVLNTISEANQSEFLGGFRKAFMPDSAYSISYLEGLQTAMALDNGLRQLASANIHVSRPVFSQNFFRSLQSDTVDTQSLQAQYAQIDTLLTPALKAADQGHPLETPVADSVRISEMLGQSQGLTYAQKINSLPRYVSRDYLRTFTHGARQVFDGNGEQSPYYEGIAYGLGLAGRFTHMDRNGITLNPALFYNTMMATMANPADTVDTEATRQNIDRLISQQQQAINAARAEAARLKAESNREAGEKFMSDIIKQPDVVTTPTGLAYKVITEGNGERPTTSDQVVIDYAGTLTDGTEFDSSYKRGQRATFGVTQVIPGFSEALQAMSPGAHYIVYIPGALGYGEHGAGDMIGPNSTLIFDITMHEVIKPQ